MNQVSLVLITVDCARADHMSFLGYERPTTPFLNSLSQNSLIFSNAIVAGAPTYYSFPAIMASRHPLNFGRDVVGLAPAEDTLASVLHESGYSTAAFVAGNPYLSPRFGYQRGFETFRDFLDNEPLEIPSNEESQRRQLNQFLAKTCHRIGMGTVYDDLYFRYCQRTAASASFDELRRFPSADLIVDHAIEWLDTTAGRNPFFLWMHFMDPHSPYYPKQEALQSLQIDIEPAQARFVNSYWNRGDVNINRLKRYREDVISLYDAGIRWVDSQIGRLVAELQTRELWPHSMLAVTADHGEEFLEHGGRYHSPSKLTEELIHVPLLLHRPEMREKKDCSMPFSLVHLAPTLLDSLNIPAPSEFRGRSYWNMSEYSNNQRIEAALIESIATCLNPFDTAQRLGPRMLAVRESEHKLVVDFAGTSEALFDLRNDPAELHPLPIDTEQAIRRRLLDHVRRHFDKSASTRDPERRLDSQLHDLRLTWEGLDARFSA